MCERETRDFLSVDSFSHLPFTRPAAPREKTFPSPSASGIRLFGVEVPNDQDIDDAAEDDPAKVPAAANGSGGDIDSLRKFECHYCCRHFPTSQALGGHQNAHKRERQNAKRAQLQSAMAAAAAAHHHQSTMDGNVYGMFSNYHSRFSSVPYARFALESTPAPGDYPSWHTSNSTGTSIEKYFCGGLSSAAQPINGSPLPGLWRVPGVVHGGTNMGIIHRNQVTSLPLLRGGEPQAAPTSKSGNGAAKITGVIRNSSSSPSSAFSPMPGTKDHVSLDLRL